jgi:dTDP-4-dehydrorhamnose reductase
LEAEVVEVKLLVTGATGLVGREVVSAAVRRGHTVYAGWHERRPEAGTPVKLDITDSGSVRNAFDMSPDVVVHLAALTDVDRCEVNEAMANELNCLATESIAREAVARGVYMVFVSTDYVFDGKRGLYAEDDKPHPVNKYGWSKLKGEQAVEDASVNSCIARISTPYGVHPFRRSFATFLADKLAAGEEVSVASDQFTSPTYTVDLSLALVEIAERRIAGILHVSGSERCSRLNFATALADRLSLDKLLIKPVLMSEIPWKAPRPRDSSLNVNRAIGLLRFRPSSLGDSLGRFAELYMKGRGAPESFNCGDARGS